MPEQEYASTVMLMAMTDGILLTVEGRSVLRFERALDHPPEKVWRAISDPAELEHWFPARVAAKFAAGWHLCLDGLAARLHDAPAPAAEQWAEHHERYARSFAT
jgi:hypothetical protein